MTVVPAVLAVLVLGGCGSGTEADPGAGSSSNPTVTTPSPSNQPNPCLGEGGMATPPDSSPGTEGYLGLTQPEAKRYAAKRDQTIRVAGRDGECFALTMDYRDDRVNLYLKDGIVVAAAIG